MIKWLSESMGLVIAAGGGAVMDDANVEAMKSCGPLVCLTADPETILLRVGSTATRPLLMVPDPLAKIRGLLAAREAHYAKADYTVDTSGLTPEEVAERVLEAING